MGGLQADGGVRSAPIRKLPIEADYLYAYSTPPGYASWCDPFVGGGSWYIQALCTQLRRHHQQLDLLHILTRVNKQVAYEYESAGFKQVPSIVSMLTKDLYFSEQQ